ncbi:hypothetical protein H6S82_04255 [Planktothrix sp. FACHB-1355]|uniref:Uncharacterized protein n=1 Tax=Aerosakkonema funiforme FACHB-1375 TaxID=2949571 RepID=A0A926ZHK4_9CYAN|nr:MULTISPECIES: hypothetical protein [Oscillatoriales]MBD2182257.1 hypothetical protein [Aerosakkonema funiforme FACHB-1375]MBD3558067.1 hypothetical protein [Planktothrix sp. FACHB-1355]
MKPAAKNTLKAFLVALYQQNSPLSESQTTKLHQIAAAISDNIAQLDTIAKSDSTFNQYYQKNRQALLNPAAVQKQGLKPKVNEAAENRAKEIENISVDLNDNELLETAQKVLTAPDPVKAAREIQTIPYLLPEIPIL